MDVIHDKVDIALNNQEVCSKISSLRQVFLLGGHKRTESPEELFDSFTCLSFSLPDDATPLSTTLCATYLAALSTDLREEMILYVRF